MKDRVRLRIGDRESGVSIPELLIGMLLMALAAALIGTAVYQFVVASRDGNDRLAALSDIQNATMWFSRDASEAASVSGGSGSVYGYINTSDPTVQYRYSYDSATTSLVRDHLVSGVPQSTVRIARHIANQSDVSFSVNGTLLSMTITATSGGVSESATVSASMRVQ